MWLRALRSKTSALSFRNPFIPFFLTLGVLCAILRFSDPAVRPHLLAAGHQPAPFAVPLGLALSLCAAVLSAYGIEHLWRSHPAQKPVWLHTTRRKAVSNSNRQHLSLLIPLVISSLITFFAGLAVWVGALIVAALDRRAPVYEPLGFARFMDRFVADVTFATHMFADGRMAFSYEARWVFIFALLLVASGIVLRVSRARSTCAGGRSERSPSASSPRPVRRRL
jgi:hypothetical protein